MSMAGYTKLFNSILGSSVWRAGKDTKILWITLLAMAEKTGIANVATPGLAAIADLTIEETERGLNVLLSPDPYSRTKEHDGRRIEAVEGGWLVLNHAKYRAKMSADERREYKAAKQREYRERDAKPSRRKSTKSTSGQSGHKVSVSASAVEGKFLEDIHCPSCDRAGFLSQQPGRKGNPPTFWCRNTGGCNQNFPIDFEEIRSQMTAGANRAIDAMSPPKEKPYVSPGMILTSELKFDEKGMLIE